MAKTKEISIGDLAVMIQHGFETVDERLSHLEKGHTELKAGQKSLFEIVRDLPSARTWDKLAFTVRDHEKRLASVERTARSH